MVNVLCDDKPITRICDIIANTFSFSKPIVSGNAIARGREVQLPHPRKQLYTL